MTTNSFGNLIIVHASCSDGMGAALVLHRAYPDAEVMFCQHGGAYPLPVDKTYGTILIADFIFPLETLKAMAAQCQKMVILDHHHQSEAVIGAFNGWCASFSSGHPHASSEGYYAANRSGALMAWHWLHGEEAVPPKLIEHISDRDLYQFRLPDTKVVSEGLRVWPLDLAYWEKAIETAESETTLIDQLKAAGSVAMALTENRIQSALRYTRRKMLFIYCDKHGNSHKDTVDVINCETGLSSDALARLYAEPGNQKTWCASYSDQAGYRLFSLRSSSEGMDVSEIANHFGGGGHVHAAGFRVPRNHILAKI